MKLFVFTDNHGSPKAQAEILKKGRVADLVLCCGDFTLFGNRMPALLRDYDSLGRPVLIIPGNHESASDLQKAAKKLKNIYYMQNSVFEVDDLIIAASEGNGFALDDPEFDGFARKVQRVLDEKQSRRKRLVLMTHAPPYGTALDRMAGLRSHCGNRSVREFILRSRPVWAFSGHMHENNGREDALGRTRILNPGPFGRLVDV